MSQEAIGVFDSGFGGLQVLRSLVKCMPEYEYVYLGDSRRAPYGDRPQSEVLEFTKEGVNFLFREGAELVLLACNTASSEALREIQKSTDRKVLGVLVPFAETAVEKSKGRIGVIATEGTVLSGAYVREIQKLAPGAFVVQQACPRLVPLVEEGKHGSELARSLVENYLRPLLASEIDTLVLGCTHYGVLEPLIREVVGPDMVIISEQEVVPRKLQEYLTRHPEVETRLGRAGTVRFYTTAKPLKFNELGSLFFGAPVDAHLALLS